MLGRFYQGSDYVSDVRTLIHDPSASDYTDTQLLGFVNKARFRVAQDCRCVRQAIYGLNTITQQEQYPLTDFVGGLALAAGGVNYSNPTLSFAGGNGTDAAGVVTQTGGVLQAPYMTNWGQLYTSQPTVTINDPTGSGGAISAINGTSILDLYLVTILQSFPAQSATLAPTMNWLPFDAFQAFCRAYRAAYSWPGAFTIHYGPTTPLNQTSIQWTVYMYPIPNQVMPMEWDAITLPNVLPTTASVDYQVVPPWYDAVQFYAAHYAFLGVSNWPAAAQMMNLYMARTRELPATARARRVHSFYRLYAKTIRRMS